MKKLIYFILIPVFIIFISACNKQEKIPDLKKIMQEIENQNLVPNTMDLNLDDLYEICYINKEDVKNFAAKISNTGIKPDEVIFIEAVSQEAANRVLESINKRCQEKRNQAENYDAKGLEIIEKNITECKNNKIVSFIVSENSGKINEIYNNSFK